MNYFKQHLTEAIDLNRSRRSYYTSIAGVNACFLSHFLVTTELMCLPLARYFDRRAQQFIEQGIPIIQNDFVSMENIRDKSTPPEYTNIAKKSQCADIKNTLKETRTNSLHALKDDNYGDVCRIISTCLHHIESIEQEAQAHFAMVKHVVESAGYAALNAPSYIEKETETQTLARQLIAIQVRLLEGSVLMDQVAQTCHRKGAGIIINDVPPIPFLDALNQTETSAKRSALFSGAI